MQANLLLKDLIEKVLRELSEFGLSTEVYRQYIRAYDRISEFASKQDTDTFSERLFISYLETIEDRRKKGGPGRARSTFLKRTMFLLKDYAQNGALEWKAYVAMQQPLPVSRELMNLHTNFINHLRSGGRSRNTIVSARNIAGQFLLFLEDSGCQTLVTAKAEIVPLFFQHLLARYSPTSMRTVASHVRSFLDFAGAKELLRAVPARCPRKKPIIPILTDSESDALRNTLRSQTTPFRDKAIILLAWQTGLRSCDILKLQLQDM